MNEQFQAVASAIMSRRNVKAAQMNGRKIPDETIRQLLELSNWAPTHGRTEPWRFFVYAGEGVASFCRQHANLYKESAAENFMQNTYDNMTKAGEMASHIIVAAMVRGDLPKIPALEEVVATSCAIENLLIGAQAAGIACFWSTGGQALQPSMKKMLHLQEQDQVLGILYLGYSDAELPAKRNSPIEAKVTWITD
jgi:nitroreductase